MTAVLTSPTVAWCGSQDPQAPLIVLLHGRRVPVFLAHGKDDHVIPREPLKRTWSYLHTGSESEFIGVQRPGGHGVTATAVDALHTWLTRATATSESTP